MGNFDASKYITERKWANAKDGTQIPISIVYRKDLVKLDGSDPLLLYGYGSYEVICGFKDDSLLLMQCGISMLSIFFKKKSCWGKTNVPSIFECFIVDYYFFLGIM